MARKSRKNRNVESNIQTVVKKENLLDTAAYDVLQKVISEHMEGAKGA